MVDSIGGVATLGGGVAPKPLGLKQTERAEKPERQDILSLGETPPGRQDVYRILTERAYEKLRAVVAEAREALGIPEGSMLDTSPEATANRIADFALGFFSKYAKNNGLEDNEEGRRQYVEFIGAAVAKGIDEARGILSALNVLNDGLNADIDKTAGLIQKRFEDFIKNGFAAQ
jgi:hypothetical protein